MVSLVVRVLLRLWREGPWGGLFAALIIYRQFRRIRYLKEACRRGNERRLTERNEMQTSLLQSFINAPPPRLEDLANDTGNDWQLR